MTIITTLLGIIGLWGCVMLFLGKSNEPKQAGPKHDKDLQSQTERLKWVRELKLELKGKPDISKISKPKVDEFGDWYIDVSWNSTNDTTKETYIEGLTTTEYIKDMMGL